MAERLQMTGLAPPASESKPVSLSPGSVLVDPRTGRVIAQAPQAPGAELNTALRREELIAARQKNEEAATSKEETVASMTDTIKAGEELLGHPGRISATGTSGIIPSLPGGQARAFDAKLDTFKSSLFLPAVQQLKGMGALSDAEGKKLEKAVAALDPLMPEEEFEASLKQLLGKLKTSRDRLEKRKGEDPSSSPGSVRTNTPQKETDNDWWEYDPGTHALRRARR